MYLYSDFEWFLHELQSSSRESRVDTRSASCGVQGHLDGSSVLSEYRPADHEEPRHPKLFVAVHIQELLPQNAVIFLFKENMKFFFFIF